MDINKLLHEPAADYWLQCHKSYEKNVKYNIKTRFDYLGVETKKQKGEILIKKMYDLFVHGFGIKWSDAQYKIFNVFIDGMLAIIYDEDWDDLKEKVLKERKLSEYIQEVLINMARRNGKTWIISACVVVAFLLIPKMTVAIFSPGKRQSGMFLQSALDKIDAAFQIGLVKKSDYKQIKRNETELVFELPDGSRNSITSLPGSIKVSLNPPLPPPYSLKIKS